MTKRPNIYNMTADDVAELSRGGITWLVVAQYDGGTVCRGDVLSRHTCVESADLRLSSRYGYAAFEVADIRFVTNDPSW